MGVTVREKPKDSGIWWVFVAHEGKRRSKRIGNDKNKALEVAEKLKAKIALKDFHIEEKEPDPVLTFEEYSKVFLDGYSKINHKQSTIDNYICVLNKHIFPVFSGKPLNEITRKDIKDFIYQKQKDLSVNTVKSIKAHISAIFGQAVDDEIIENNPAAQTGRYIKKQENNKKIRPFSQEEVDLFEEAVKKYIPKYYPFFLCALRTGMRRGELISLKPGDIDFNGKFIEVKRHWYNGHITLPKSGKTRRVDMSTQLSNVLKSYLIQRKEDTLKRGWGEPPEWLFYNRKGKIIDPDNIRKQVFYRCLEKAGLRRIRLHDLRHTYATLRITAGHNIADVSKQLGHHSIKITIDTYYHWIPGSNRSEVDELDSNNKNNILLTKKEPKT